MNCRQPQSTIVVQSQQKQKQKLSELLTPSSARFYTFHFYKYTTLIWKQKCNKLNKLSLKFHQQSWLDYISHLSIQSHEFCLFHLLISANTSLFEFIRFTKVRKGWNWKSSRKRGGTRGGKRKGRQNAKAWIIQAPIMAVRCSWGPGRRLCRVGSSTSCSGRVRPSRRARLRRVCLRRNIASLPWESRLVSSSARCDHSNQNSFLNSRSYLLENK